MVNFPAPIGGTVLPSDFAPSIFFAVLYGLLVPVIFYRMLHRRSRCILLIGTMAFSIERIAIFSLRAVQAHNEKKRFSHGLITYLQVSFGMGFIGIANDLVNIVRVLLVNPTYGPERYPESPAAATKDGVMKAPPPGTPDLTSTRFWIRQFTGIWGLAFLAATVPGIIANSKYARVLDHQDAADSTAEKRLWSTAIAFAFSYVVLASAIWGFIKLPRISKKGVVVIGLITVYISIISIYRLAVMPTRVDSLTDPSPLNTPRGKAAFYILHVLPEWLASVTLFSVNVRKYFGTGPFGDYRFRDETEKEKEKRLKREAKKAEKKRDANGEKYEFNQIESGKEKVATPLVTQVA